METPDTEFIKFWIKDGILYNEFKEDIILTPDIAKKIIGARHKISNGEKQYWCYSIDHINSFTKEGTKYIENYGQDFLNATAFVTNSRLKKLLFNFFLNIFTPRVPIQAFNTKEDAIKWLRQKMELDKTLAEHETGKLKYYTVEQAKNIVYSKKYK